MSVGEFYDDTSPEVWKKAIGEDLHYHVGWGEGDILYNAIEYLYPFIGRDSKVLDCGCGWGGPAKVLKRDLNCEVTGVTISKVQYDYVKSNVPIEIIYSDLHDYNPNDRFDVCLFIESFCHLENPLKVLYNIRDCSNKIILREYHLKSDDYPKKYVDSWLMNIYKKDEMISLFDKIGFKLTFDENHYDYSLEPTLNYWLDNLKKIDNSEKTHHINTLEFSARYLKKNLNQVLNDIGLSTFIFEKC
tara:strand:+ start:2378 stop:3112 length:735 start_codon:yes stop_codon:yes gene_type:complete